MTENQAADEANISEIVKRLLVFNLKHWKRTKWTVSFFSKRVLLGAAFMTLKCVSDNGPKHKQFKFKLQFKLVDFYLDPISPES